MTHANERRSHEGSDSGDILNKGRHARWGAALVTMVLCGLLIAHITAQLRGTGIGSFTSIYTIVIAGFIFSRFVLAAMYRAPRNARLEPNLAIIVPAFMESEAVARTIDSCCAKLRIRSTSPSFNGTFRPTVAVPAFPGAMKI